MRIPWRIQIGLVVCGYGMVLGIAAILIFWRYLQYVTHPADRAASGGMWVRW